MRGTEEVPIDPIGRWTVSCHGWGRLPCIHGKEERWGEWSLQTNAFLTLMRHTVGENMDRLERPGTNRVTMETLGWRQACSWKFYYSLTMLFKGPPLTLLREIPGLSGYDASIHSHARYDANLAMRQHSLLTKIWKPKQFAIDHLRWENPAAERRREENACLKASESRFCWTTHQQRCNPRLPCKVTQQADEVTRAVISILEVRRHLEPASAHSPDAIDVDAEEKEKRRKGKYKKHKSKDRKDKDSERETRTCYNCNRAGHLAANC